MTRDPAEANCLHVYGFHDRQGDGLCDWHVGRRRKQKMRFLTDQLGTNRLGPD